VLRGLVEDESRTQRICDDIAAAKGTGHHCLGLTRWTEDLDALVDALRARGVQPLVLHGQLGRRARTDGPARSPVGFDFG
jgi:hypothetical protein